jgi:hypothetical protein
MNGCILLANATGFDLPILCSDFRPLRLKSKSAALMIRKPEKQIPGYEMYNLFDNSAVVIDRLFLCC